MDVTPLSRMLESSESVAMSWWRMGDASRTRDVAITFVNHRLGRASGALSKLIHIAQEIDGAFVSASWKLTVAVQQWSQRLELHTSSQHECEKNGYSVEDGHRWGLFYLLSTNDYNRVEPGIYQLHSRHGQNHKQNWVDEHLNTSAGSFMGCSGVVQSRDHTTTND